MDDTFDPTKDEFGRIVTKYDMIPINPDMGEGRYQDALRRMIKRIHSGLKLHSEDSNSTGDKYTICSWGMCSHDKDQWPNADDHTWPTQFIHEGRIAPRSKPRFGCPMDTRHGTKSDDPIVNGCFYTCRVFQRKLETPNREEAIMLYTNALAKREEEYGKKTIKDDGEEWIISNEEMEKIAYTVGHKDSYLLGLKEDSFRKLGRMGKYEGGAVFRSKIAAEKYVEKHSDNYGVFKLILPNGWKQDVDMKNAWKEGFGRLNNDAKIEEA